MIMNMIVSYLRIFNFIKSWLFVKKSLQETIQDKLCNIAFRMICKSRIMRYFGFGKNRDILLYSLLHVDVGFYKVHVNIRHK